MAFNQLLLETKNRPCRSIVRAMESPGYIRVYRASPSEISFQIRLKNQYVLVQLLPDEARAIAAKLNEFADELTSEGAS